MEKTTRQARKVRKNLTRWIKRAWMRREYAPGFAESCTFAKPTIALDTSSLLAGLRSARECLAGLA